MTLAKAIEAEGDIHFFFWFSFVFIHILLVEKAVPPKEMHLMIVLLLLFLYLQALKLSYIYYSTFLQLYQYTICTHFVQIVVNMCAENNFGRLIKWFVFFFVHSVYLFWVRKKIASSIHLYQILNGITLHSGWFCTNSIAIKEKKTSS